MFSIMFALSKMIAAKLAVGRCLNSLALSLSVGSFLEPFEGRGASYDGFRK